MYSVAKIIEGASEKRGHLPFEIFSSLKNVMAHLRHVNNVTTKYNNRT